MKLKLPAASRSVPILGLMTLVLVAGTWYTGSATVEPRAEPPVVSEAAPPREAEKEPAARPNGRLLAGATPEGASVAPSSTPPPARAQPAARVVPAVASERAEARPMAAGASVSLGEAGSPVALPEPAAPLNNVAQERGEVGSVLRLVEPPGLEAEEVAGSRKASERIAGYTRPAPATAIRRPDLSDPLTTDAARTRPVTDPMAERERENAARSPAEPEAVPAAPAGGGPAAG